MIYKIFDKTFKFIYFFNTENGSYVRTGILNKDGVDTGVDPFIGSFPHLIDIGIMGHCIHGKTGLCFLAGIECYQSGKTIERDNMSLEDYTSIIKQCRGKTNQVALGGRGDPDQHKQFEEILRVTRLNGIIPSFTTSGFGMNDEIARISKKYCGAVAVSWYRSDYTLKAIETLIKHGVRTSVHYVLSNSTIDEALLRLENDTFPLGIKTLIFLLHKPKGHGTRRNVIKADDERIIKLFKLVDTKKFPFDVGFDSCSVPGLVNHTKNIIPETIEPCEGARFSCYISSELIMTPCSFDTEQKFGVSLYEYSIKEAWFSNKFKAFRKNPLKRCMSCKLKEYCLGGCPLIPEIILCNNKEKEIIVYED